MVVPHASSNLHVHIDAVNRCLTLHDGTTISYDTLSCNVGSIVTPPSPLPPTVIPVKPIEGLLSARTSVLNLLADHKEPSFLIVGGGPAGVELAGAIWRLTRKNRNRVRITLANRGRILTGMPCKAHIMARRSLESRGIIVHENASISAFTDDSALLATGEELPFHLALLATGVVPSQLFRASGLPVAEDGSLLVDSRLQSIAHPEILGGGDCITPIDGALARVGVYAVRQGPVLYANFLARITDTPLNSFSARNTFLQILNMGDGTGILVYGNHVLQGSVIYLLKQFIDGRFMRRYQQCGERDTRT